MFSQLKEIVGDENIMEDPATLSDLEIDGIVPKAAVYPENEDEISQIIKLAKKKGWAVIPRGGGTKMGIGEIPGKADIILSLSRLNKLLDLDLGNLHITAQAGMTFREAQAALAGKGSGYFIRLDPQFRTSATIGGIVATNASGPRRLLYGSARDMILGIGFIAPNGDRIGVGGRTVKNVSGYDVNKLMIGMFGTLGVITEATFKFLPLPEKSGTLLAFFSGIEDVARLINRLLDSNLYPASIDILNARAANELSIESPDKDNYIVAIGIEGVEESLDRQAHDIKAMGKEGKAIEIRSLSGNDHENFWDSISNFPKTVLDRYSKAIACKSNFLISQSTEMVRIWEETSAKNDLNWALISHAGSGILYSYLMAENIPKENLDVLLQHLEDMTDQSIKREGNLVLEFAPIAVKEKMSVWGSSRGDLRLMKELKKQIDPTRILNPGRFIGGI